MKWGRGRPERDECKYPNRCGNIATPTTTTTITNDHDTTTHRTFLFTTKATYSIFHWHHIVLPHMYQMNDIHLLFDSIWFGFISISLWRRRTSFICRTDWLTDWLAELFVHSAFYDQCFCLRKLNQMNDRPIDSRMWLLLFIIWFACLFACYVGNPKWEKTNEIKRIVIWF